MIGCCVKDNGEENIEFMHHNVSADDMNRGKMECEVQEGRVEQL